MPGLSFIKRWGPVAGSVALVGSVVARIFGHADVANSLSSVGGLLGTDLPLGDLVAAAAVTTGVVLKVKSQIKKAVEGE